ncbi:hypothetical protein COOONC_24355 [Cooperia oncophora]
MNDQPWEGCSAVKNLIQSKYHGAQEKADSVRLREKAASSDAALNAVNESLALLLNGQQRIGSRIDSLKRDQEISKQHLEDALKSVIDELKAELAGKSQEQSEKLEKLRLKTFTAPQLLKRALDHHKLKTADELAANILSPVCEKAQLRNV